MLAVAVSMAVLAACLPAASGSTPALLLACVATITSVVCVGWFASAMSRSGLDALAASTREWMRPRVTPLVGALGGAPIEPSAFDRNPRLVPERYARIATMPVEHEDELVFPRAAARFWPRRTPMTERYGTRLMWSVLVVVYVYLVLFALVVLFSVFDK
ncbi:MAG TPA: hypothetical protein VH986_13235 [Acidimicrobiia bacterium]